MEYSPLSDKLSQREINEAYVKISHDLTLFIEAREQFIASVMGEEDYIVAKNWRDLSEQIKPNGESGKILQEFESKVFIDFMYELFFGSSPEMGGVREKAEKFIKLTYPDETLDSLAQSLTDHGKEKAMNIAVHMFESYSKPQEQILYETVAEDCEAHFTTAYYCQTTGTREDVHVSIDQSGMDIALFGKEASMMPSRPSFETRTTSINLLDGKIVFNHEVVEYNCQLHDVLEIINVVPNMAQLFIKEREVFIKESE